MRVFFSFLLSVGLLSAGCQANAVDAEAAFEVTSSPTGNPVLPDSGATQMTPSPPTDAGLQNLIDKAIADLANRLSISAAEITVLEATPVVWPDASLGCPQEGMGYAQVLTPGYLIRLQSGDQSFEYHASRSNTLIFCENPTPPVPGTPADT